MEKRAKIAFLSWNRYIYRKSLGLDETSRFHTSAPSKRLRQIDKMQLTQPIKVTVNLYAATV